ncbi:MAG: S8 family peptidase [Sphingomonadales bacterium]|jgi:hypothetical protein
MALFRLVGPCAALALLLAGCAGGSAGSGALTATAPTPPAAPPATPPASAFDTAEYRRSNGAVGIQALSAYDRGFSGQGVSIAVIDSGVNPALAEFAGRIAAASRDVAANRPMGDDRGHGTSVAGAALAARNGVGIQGVAPLATLLALRADTPGSCTDQGCSYASSAIAAGLDAAADAGVRVVNVSLGGTSTTTAVRVAAGRAAASAVLVLAAGNEGLATPQAFANQLVAVSPATTIVVGAVTASNEIASFSNRAGVLASNFLVAPGVDVRSFNQDGTAFLYSGTSIAAPLVSGAAALLSQAFPALTPAQIADILFRSADDLGAPGTDEIYGRGLVNLTRAFQPLGVATIGGQPVALTAGGTLGGALGDGGALRGALANVTIADDYGRDFRVDLGQTLRNAPIGRLAARLLTQPVEQASIVDAAGNAAAFALIGDGRAAGRNLWAGDRATFANLAPGQRPQASPVGHVRLALAGGSVVVAGQGEGVAGMMAMARPTGISADLVTADQAVPLGSRALGGAALSQPLGGDFTLVAGFGQSVLASQSQEAAALQSTLMMGLSRQLGPALQITATLRRDKERGSLLGTRLSTGFGLSGSATTSVGVSAQLDLGGARLAGEYRSAFSRLGLAPGGLIAQAGAFNGSAASLAISFDDVAMPGDSLTFAITRPLALSGMLAILGREDPVHTGPSVRETALEAVHAMPLAGGQLQFSLFHRQHPGHVASAPDDDGAALRMRWAW